MEQATVLIVDQTPSERDCLRELLEQSHLTFIEADGVSAAVDLALRQTPDLIISHATLPDGSAADLKRQLNQHPKLSELPMIALGCDGSPMDAGARQAASDSTSACCIQTTATQAERIATLATGVDEALICPVEPAFLRSRIRSLVHQRETSLSLGFAYAGLAHDSLGLSDASLGAGPGSGFGEALPPAFTPALRVALVAPDGEQAANWRAALAPHCRHSLRSHSMAEAQALFGPDVPDVVVLSLQPEPLLEASATQGPQHRPATLEQSYQLLANLRSRLMTLDCIVIAVTEPGLQSIAAEALDHGAHDVLSHGFNGRELALRITRQQRHKRFANQLRRTLRAGLKAAIEDPMTGLKNRRYALPYLERMIRAATDKGEALSVLVADLDHFKDINDRFGHSIGDRVLIEAAKRLSALMGHRDMLARIGGEEFLIVLPGSDAAEASRRAETLRAAIHDRKFSVPCGDLGSGLPLSLEVSISIGATALPPAFAPAFPPASPTAQLGSAPGLCADMPPEAQALIDQADLALYEAKANGRNQVANHADPKPRPRPKTKAPSRSTRSAA